MILPKRLSGQGETAVSTTTAASPISHQPQTRFSQIAFVKNVSAVLPIWVFGILGWLIVLVSLRERRNYQDSWVLEDVFPYVLAFCAAFVWVLFRETHTSRITVFSALFVTILRLIPGLKYKWAYGTAVDQMVHISSIQRIMESGFPPAGTPYTDIPGMHALLGVIGMVSETAVDDVVGIAFPLILGLIPFFIYFLTSQFRINDILRNQIIIMSALAFDPYFLLIQGSPFGVLLIMLVLVLFLSREFGSIYIQLPLTIALLGSIMALTFGHGISSLIFILLIAGMPIALRVVNKFWQLPIRNQIGSGASRLFTFTVVLFSSWWMYQARGVFLIFVNQIWSFISRAEVEKAPIPSRVSELGIIDLFLIFWSLHGNIFMMALLAGIGVFILWWHRNTLSPRFHTALIALFLIELGLSGMLVGQLLTGFGNLEYFRLLGYAVVLTPFFGGAALWLIRRKSQLVWGAFLMLLILASLFQIFPYQPGIPGGDRLFAHIRSDEYLLYLHTVVTDYQKNMLDYVQTHIDPTYSIMSDRVTKDEAYRFWGPELATEYGIRYQIYATADLDEGEWDYLLLHRAGLAGPFSEQIEVRHDAQVDRILSSTDYAIVYDNGESYVLQRR
ncbi:MAG: hypothetical protein GY943_21620 [Chloroflexi bacterium]|nr:hypothetical protein [Chloroflexota bacterium]